VVTSRVVWRGPQLMATVEQRVLATMQQLGFVLVRLVQTNTPVRTGKAQRSVTMEVRREGSQIVLRWGGTVSYFIWIEIGTRGRPGKAPVGRTFDEAVTLLKRELVGLV
jgi:hypothetical protein